MSYIELHYGPYSANGTVKHRVNRLMNLVHYLILRGNTVELMPSIHMDTLEVVIGLRVAFRCRITFLSQLNYEVFGKNHDPVLVKAIEAIDETLSRTGQVGPNLRVPGIYREMFSISSDFGGGIVHNNYPGVLNALLFQDEDVYSVRSQQGTIVEKTKPPRTIKFVNF